MIFQDTWEKVLSGEKTQQRVIVKPMPSLVRIGNYYTYDAVLADDVWTDEQGEVSIDRVVSVYYRHGGWVSGSLAVEPEETYRTVYRVGNTYAVQPGRGQKAVGLIRINYIRREDVRYISHKDLKAEGLTQTTRLNFLRLWASMHDRKIPQLEFIEDSVDRYMDRPAERYDAWVLEFERVEVVAS